MADYFLSGDFSGSFGSPIWVTATSRRCLSSPLKRQAKSLPRPGPASLLQAGNLSSSEPLLTGRFGKTSEPEIDQACPQPQNRKIQNPMINAFIPSASKPRLAGILATLTCCAGCVIENNGFHTQSEPPPGEVVIVEASRVSPVVVQEYYYVGNRYYYWHPDSSRYVVLAGHPPAGYRVVPMARLTPRDAMGRPATPRISTQPPVRPPAAVGQSPSAP